MPSSTFAAVVQFQKIISHPTWDLVVLFALVAGGLLYGITAGRRKIVSTLMLTYVASALFSAIPAEVFANMPWVKEKFVALLGMFLALFLLLAWLLGARRARGFASDGSWWQIFLLSFLQMGLLIHIILGFLPFDRIQALAPLTRNVFANPNTHFWWLAAPVVVLILIRRLEARDG